MRFLNPCMLDQQYYYHQILIQLYKWRMDIYQRVYNFILSSKTIYKDYTLSYIIVQTFFLIYSQRYMPILCCQNQPGQIIQHEFEPKSEVDIEPCLLHGKKVSFVCNDRECQLKKNTLLCHECLKQHRSHEWKTREQFFTKSFKSIVQKNINTNIREVLRQLQQTFSKQLQISVVDTFNNSLNRMQQVFQNSILQIQQEFSDKIEMRKTLKNINMQNFQDMKEVYNEQKEQIVKIQQISRILTHSLQHLGHSISKLIEVLQLQVQTKAWRNHQIMEKFQNQIESYDLKNQFVQQQKNYFHFSPLLKHDNIRLESSNKAIYYYDMPSRPAAMTFNSVGVDHNKFGFEIIKMQSRAIFFQCTTIFLGVCDQQIVKLAGMRKINQQSKGSYLISSAGWSYHHKDENYNRNENVGWTFGEGDKVQVEIVFNRQVGSKSNSKIIFVKKGRFFDNSFEMPLKLPNQQIRKLKPCISFDANKGAIVAIYDIK